MSDTKKNIEDTDLNVDRLENLAKLVVDRWDMDCLLDYAQSCLFQDYQYDIDRAVSDAEDYTLEELDFERPAEGDLF
ncbi:MAG: hypothetical protein VW683_11450 [Betaproteobacteria bacterium]